MGQKKHKPEEIVAKLWQVDVLLSQGRSVAEAIRTISVTPFTYYRWRKEFGGLKSDQVKRLKDLEKENERLRKAVSDLTLERLESLLQGGPLFRGQTRSARLVRPTLPLSSRQRFAASSYQRPSASWQTRCLCGRPQCSHRPFARRKRIESDNCGQSSG